MYTTSVEMLFQCEVSDEFVAVFLKCLGQEESGRGWMGKERICQTTHHGGAILELVMLSFLVNKGLNSHYFHIMGDGHQPNSRGLYTHYKDSY